MLAVVSAAGAAAQSVRNGLAIGVGVGTFAGGTLGVIGESRSDTRDVVVGVGSSQAGLAAGIALRSVPKEGRTYTAIGFGPVATYNGEKNNWGYSTIWGPAAVVGWKLVRSEHVELGAGIGVGFMVTQPKVDGAPVMLTADLALAFKAGR